MNNKDIDKKVIELLNKVAEKKKQIGNAQRPSWITNCSFGFDVNDPNLRTNIQVIQSLEDLVNMHALLTAKFDTFNNSMKVLGLEKDEASFKWFGFSYQQWVADIETRVNQLRIKKKTDEIKQKIIKEAESLSEKELKKRIRVNNKKRKKQIEERIKTDFTTVYIYSIVYLGLAIFLNKTWLKWDFKYFLLGCFFFVVVRIVFLILSNLILKYVKKLIDKIHHDSVIELNEN